MVPCSSAKRVARHLDPEQGRTGSAEGDQKQDATENAPNPACGYRLVPAPSKQQISENPAQYGANDAQQHRRYRPHVLRSRQDSSGDQTNDQSEYEKSE